MSKPVRGSGNPGNRYGKIVPAADSNRPAKKHAEATKAPRWRWRPTAIRKAISDPRATAAPAAIAGGAPNVAGDRTKKVLMLTIAHHAATAGKSRIAALRLRSATVPFVRTMR